MKDFEQGVDLETRARALLAQAREAYQRGFEARSLDALHALIRLNVADGDFANAKWLMQYVPGPPARSPRRPARERRARRARAAASRSTATTSRT